MTRNPIFGRTTLLTAALFLLPANVDAQPKSSAPSTARAIVATGIWVNAGKVPSGFDPAFAQALRGWNVAKGGSAAACHLVVDPWGKYLLAIGFFDPQTKAGLRLQDVVIDGRKVDTLDPAGPRPFVRLYEVADLNGNGYLQVSCSHAKDESGATGQMNIVWVFAAEAKKQIERGEACPGQQPDPAALPGGRRYGGPPAARARELSDVGRTAPAPDAAVAAGGP